MTETIPGFSDAEAEIDGVTIAYSRAGGGPPLLLLHGFPQTRAMWRQVAPVLAQTHDVVVADLRGYGGSSKPTDVAAMRFRNMARDQHGLMAHLGFARFHIAGHDRGGRVAHRLALDFEPSVASLTLMDIVPTHFLLNDLKKSVAKSYYHWFFLAQPSPFPETIIERDPDFYFESCLLGWGGAKLDEFDAEALKTYRHAWRDTATIRCMCNDYRAALDLDFADDAADLNRQITCPALVLYGGEGAMAKIYDVPKSWEDRLSNMRAAAMPGGHFFIDLAPEETTDALHGFLKVQPPL